MLQVDQTGTASTGPSADSWRRQDICVAVTGTSVAEHGHGSGHERLSGGRASTVERDDGDDDECSTQPLSAVESFVEQKGAGGEPDKEGRG